MIRHLARRPPIITVQTEAGPGTEAGRRRNWWRRVLSPGCILCGRPAGFLSSVCKDCRHDWHVWD